MVTTEISMFELMALDPECVSNKGADLMWAYNYFEALGRQYYKIYRSQV